MGRSIKLMHPVLACRYHRFHELMVVANLNYIITSVDRSLDVQMALYVQGRLSLNDINKFRKAVDLRMLHDENEAKKIVTRTLNSRHIIRKDSNNSDDHYSKAFDLALLKGTSVHWDIKASINDNDIPDYLEVADIALKVGLESGATWGDYVHIQLPR